LHERIRDDLHVEVLGGHERADRHVVVAVRALEPQDQGHELTGSCQVDERLQVSDFALDTEASLVRPAEAAAAAIGDVDGEGRRQGGAQLHEVLRRLHPAMYQDDAGARPGAGLDPDLIWRNPMDVPSRETTSPFT
jgi:hypothetical protein